MLEVQFETCGKFRVNSAVVKIGGANKTINRISVVKIPSHVKG